MNIAIHEEQFTAYEHVWGAYGCSKMMSHYHLNYTY